MGVNNSTTSRRMSNSEDETEAPSVLRPSSPLNGEDLPAIVEYLIRSGQFHFISQSRGDSDSGDNSSDGAEFVTMPSYHPPVDPSPDVASIQKSDIHTSVLQSSGRLAKKKWQHYVRPTLPNMISLNQLGMNSGQQLSQGDMCVLNSRFLPNYMERKARYNHKAFCGKYSEDGNVYMTACQDTRIRVYNTENDMKLVKSICARDVGWSVLDTAFSPDGQYAAYSSWSDCIHFCNIHGDYDIHEALHIDPGEHSFCIFSLMFSSDNQEILGGANDGHIYVYDRELHKRTLKIHAHDDDVNTVRFANESTQILYSGGDDGLCKVWDRRTLREQHPSPVGTMAGHSDGITFIDSKGDGRYFISNSKDQTLKLWDVRHFSDTAGIAETKRIVAAARWDYRWERAPRRRKKQVKGDSSVMTYRGHCILHTLIRCKFSPMFNTGQRYIYSGCATGSVVVYDVLTGQIVKKLDGHSSCVRDVDWHPYKNIIMSTSWDGSIGQWTYLDHHALSGEAGETVRQWTYLDHHALSGEAGETVFETPKPPPSGHPRRGSFRASQVQRPKSPQEAKVDKIQGLFE
ncbi:Ddb1- and cul4-associated factor 11 [Plakobranchus ocellatus]|uniref:Ddb1- and cul4-associated factor 11 n=1 Tax=Plakobranchus ocellatus TaxID=259542 RepID=A0AAV3Z1W5_9GAST|nr:Ddb1- and cul4-associated factor 11 [Plakobranchus ocellatus]